MATVHPSRMGLVPQDPPTYYQGDTRGPSIPSRPNPRRNNDTDYRQSSRRRYEERDSRRRSRDRSEGRGRSVSPERTQRRSRSRSRSRERRRDGGHNAENAQGRRRSPEYGDYRRPSPPRRADSPSRRQQGDMYANRRDYERLPYNPGVEFLDSRRVQRQNAQVSIWPKSPKAPTRSLSPSRDKSRKKSKRSRSASISDSDPSSDEDERRKRKERKRARKEREREHKHKKKHRSRSRRRSVNAVSEDERRSRRRRSLSRSRTGTPAKEQRPPSPSRSPSPSAGASDGEWVEKSVANAPVPIAARATSETAKGEDKAGISSDYYSDDDVVGPVPLIRLTGKQKVDERAYGGALLRGEGSAMAAYLQDNTDARIPRRGEIGLTSDQIAEFENVGYVMSGSRHRRMNAVRIRKENQVISAEEKRGILKLQKEEQSRREAILQEEFKELVNEKLKGAPAGPSEST